MIRLRAEVGPTGVAPCVGGSRAEQREGDERHYHQQRSQYIPHVGVSYFRRPIVYDPENGEGEKSLRTGCPAIIQGRENIRYGVNAMLVGGVFDDTYAEGRSTIAANTGRPDACWDDGILAMATRPDTEEIIAATVELPG